MHAITIAARNYLAMARTVAASFVANNPGSSFTILVVDAEVGEISATDEYEIASPADLSLSAAEFGRMAFLYDVTELSTALKPWALEMLLETGAEVAVYLDPDIYVYDSLNEIEVESREHGIVLTPHTLTPMPRDGLRPSEADIMGAGVYNLGFIAVGKRDRDMLAWWQQRLRRDSISAPEQMLFTDQRWIDLVPGYFDHKILRDPGYNVAYWNLDSRPITKDGERYLVDGAPLRFFHFSGYRPDRPWVLSKYVDDRPRIVLSENPVVRELCDAYASELRTRRIENSADTPYRFNRFSDGTPIVPGLRRMYRQAVIDAEEAQVEPPPAPFVDDDAAILDWFRERVRGGSWVNRAAYALWLSRADLQAAFPDLFGKDREAYLAWCLSSGISEQSIVATLLPTEPITANQTTATGIPGVNLAGYFYTETGVGQIGRLLVEAVRATGLPYSTMPVRRTVSRQQAEFEGSDSLLRYPINVVSVNADQFTIWADEQGNDLLTDRYTIGVWAWEIEDFPPAFDPAIALVDEIWAISSFGQAAIAKRTDKPVHVIPYQIPEAHTAEPLDLATLGLADRPYFLFMFDYLSVFARKNPLGVVEAFTRAFPEPAADGPMLVIKSVSGDRFRSQREQLRHACAGRSDIRLIESYLAYEQVQALMAECAAYISLHRAEGLGLTLSESMSAGRPVIATGYSGNLDFMNADNSLLVPYRMVPIGPDAAPYAAAARWAEPDLAVAAEHLRWVFEHPAEAAELGRRAQESVRGSHGLDRAASFVAGRVQEILARGEALPEAEPAAAVPAPATELVPAPALTDQKPGAGSQHALDEAQALLDVVPDVATPSRYPRVAPFLRRAVRRVLSHHDEQVNVRLNSILAATRAVAERQRELEATTRATEEAAILRQSRTESTLQEALAATSDRLTSAESELRAIVPKAARVDDLSSGFVQHRKELTQLDRNLNQTTNELAAQIARLDTLAQMSAENHSQLEGHRRQFDDVVQRLDELNQAQQRLDAELIARPYQSRPDALRLTTPDGRTVLGYHGGGEPTSYASFEDVFRGSEEFVQQRLLGYVDLVREHAPVLDIGCGRGEFVRLLSEGDIPVRGIDTDPSMVARAQQAGLAVELGDGVAALQATRPASLGAVTSFQVAEHLELAVLTQLFRAGFTALETGGVFIAETVNPHAPAALKTFWLDLTHIRPLFPESLLFLAREVGFDSAEIFFPHGTGGLDADLRSCGEYALIARKG